MRRLFALLLLGCGGPSAVAPAVVAAPPVRVTSPVDLSGSVATIEIVDVPDGLHVHSCRFVLVSGQFAGWLCGTTPSSTTFPLAASTTETLVPLLAAVDDWGTETTDGTTDPIAITLYGDRTIAHFHVDPAHESPALTAFRTAAMAAAQDGLAVLRERAEACTTCGADEYCEEQWACSTLGPDKNCLRVIECERRLPATSRCAHHYQCASHHCDGTTEAIGACAP